MTQRHPVFLLTGLPTSFVAQQLLVRLLVVHTEARVQCLVAESMLEKAQQTISHLPEHDQARVELVRGDPTGMDFGLAGRRFVELAKQVDVIHHCVCANYAGVGRDAERRTYVGSTGEVLELALASEGRVQRLVHWGSVLVAQPNNGRVTETEWLAPASFRNRTDEMRFRAEVLIRDAMNRTPITILRPSIVFGDSRTGDIDRHEAPHALLRLLLSSPIDSRNALPGRGDQPCHFVPVDYVVNAGLTIADDPRSAGRTFHLTDERPLSVARVFELIAEMSERPVTSPRLSRNLASLLLHAPGLERTGQVPKAFWDLLGMDVAYDARNTRELLAGRGIECPNLAGYLKLVLAHVRSEKEARGKPRRTRRYPHFEEMDDPLDS
jgi:thioester reductase-like protein